MNKWIQGAGNTIRPRAELLPWRGYYFWEFHEKDGYKKRRSRTMQWVLLKKYYKQGDVEDSVAYKIRTCILIRAKDDSYAYQSFERHYLGERYRWSMKWIWNDESFSRWGPEERHWRREQHKQRLELWVEIYSGNNTELWYIQTSLLHGNNGRETWKSQWRRLRGGKIMRGFMVILMGLIFFNVIFQAYKKV